MTTAVVLDDLWAAVEDFDDEASDLALATLLGDVPLFAAVTTVVLPFLQQIGDRWEDGRLSVAHEHFASNLLRRRLGAFAPKPSIEGPPTTGPIVLLACPPGERHDLVLLCFGLMLRERDARVRFLGADTPVPAIVEAARRTNADAIVVAATRSTALTAHASSLMRLAERHPVYVAGRGADQQVAAQVGAELLPADPADALTALLGALEGCPQR